MNALIATVPLLRFKVCTCCGGKFLSSNRYFYEDKRLRDGLMTSCKSCRITATVGTETPEKRTYQNMIQRCHNPRARGYRWYGAKGVQVCERWRESYQDFLADVGNRPGNGYAFGRTGDVGNYEPGNVSWVVWAEQHKTRVANIQRRVKAENAPRWPCGKRKQPLRGTFRCETKDSTKQ